MHDVWSSGCSPCIIVLEKRQDSILGAQLAEMAGISASYTSRLINRKNGILNKVSVIMLDKLGYDFQVTYVKKDI